MVLSSSKVFIASALNIYSAFIRFLLLVKVIKLLITNRLVHFLLYRTAYTQQEKIIANKQCYNKRPKKLTATEKKNLT